MEKIEIIGPKSISNVFSVFHDGSVERVDRAADRLVLTISIQYLAELISSEFRCFKFEIEEPAEIQFEAWSEPSILPNRILTDTSMIFSGDLEIMKGELSDDRVNVVCYEHDDGLDYSGGVLSFTSQRATVEDEAGKKYSEADLAKLANQYWDNWEREAKRSKLEK